MKIKILWQAVLFFALASSGTWSFAQLKPPAPGQAHNDFGPPRIQQGQKGPKGVDSAGLEKVMPGEYRIGELRISKKLKCVTFPAQVNMNRGLLEYVLVRNGGKTHESLLRTDVSPYDLNVALLLLGLEGTDRPLERQGDPDVPQGDKVEIRISGKNADGKTFSITPEEWISRKQEEKMVQATSNRYVYTGSVIRDNRFLAQMEGSMVALYHDPVAMIDNASPGGESDKVWFVREGAVPPVGTPVTVTIRPAK